jgi:hypothetical protein
VDQQYLPDKVSGRRYYVPIRGVELEMEALLRKGAGRVEPEEGAGVEDSDE